MVVERIFQIKDIQKHPCLISAVAFVFVCISVILATMAHQPPMGFFIIALTVMPAIPFFMRMTICEEKKEELLMKFISAIPEKKFEKGKREGLVSLYDNIIKLYVYFFLGCVIGFAFTYSIMPAETSRSMFMDLQFLSPNTPDVSFWGIFSHNFKLMLIMVFFSLVYSIGAIFLLVLNGAIIGLFLEQEIRAAISGLSYLGVLTYPPAFVLGSLNGILKLLPHGMWEFSAFFMASVAGGILSVAIERKAYKRMPLFKKILFDIAKLLMLAILLVAVGAFIESSYPMVRDLLKIIKIE
jgi:uncharacterized membrane protein SpoIIM required for sporulation